MVGGHAGIDHCLALIADVEALGIDAISIIKTGHFGFTAIYRGIKAVSDIYHLLTEAAHVFPELKDLDAVEAGRLTTAGYETIRKIALEVIK